MSIFSRRRGNAALAIAATIASAVTAVALSATRAPADTGATCNVNYTIAWQTPSNNPPDFGATVTITNTSAYPISNWTATWAFSAGQTIVAGTAYSANVTQSGSTVTATPEAGYNATLAAGASTTWGFNADYNGTVNPVPTVTCSGPGQGSARRHPLRFPGPPGGQHGRLGHQFPGPGDLQRPFRRWPGPGPLSRRLVG